MEEHWPRWGCLNITVASSKPNCLDPTRQAKNNQVRLDVSFLQVSFGINPIGNIPPFLLWTNPSCQRSEQCYFLQVLESFILPSIQRGLNQF